MKSKISLILTVFFLLGMCYGQVDAVPLDDHGDTWKEATDLFLNGSQTGQIDAADDIDYFRLEITEAGELTVWTTGSLDTIGSMEDDAGVFANGDQGGEGNNFSIVYNAKPETYYISVRGNQNATGSYTLHASLSVPWEQVPEQEIIKATEADIVEVPEADIIKATEEAPGADIIVDIADPEDHIIVDPENHTRSHATNLVLGTHISASIDFVGDEDYYRVQVSPSEAGQILFETTGSTDTIGRLYNSSGTLLTSNDDSGVSTNFRIVRTLSWGTYYLRVDEYNDNATGDYVVTATTDIDPGPELGSAQNISLGASSAEAINFPGDVDYFRVRVTAFGQLTTYTTGSTDTYGRLYNSSGSRLASNDDGGASLNFRIAYVVAPGTYYIRVNELGDNHTGTYNIYTGFVADDHRNSRSSASSISLNGTRSGTINYNGDVDYFSLEVSAPMPLTLYTTGSTDTQGRLENSNGSSLTSNDDGGAGTNFKIVYDVSPGTYYIRVNEFGNNGTGSYTLHAYTPVDDHGNSRDEATTLSLHSPLTAAINPGTDVDYFSVTVGATSSTTALIIETTGITDTVGRLENSSGSTLTSDDDGGTGANFRISQNVAPGTYYIRVGSFDNRTGSYTLQASIGQIDVDVNGDDVVNAADLVIAATNYGTQDATFAQGDVNDDDVVDRADIIAILDVLDDDSATAPNLYQTGQMPIAESLQRWIDQAKQLNNADLDFQKGIVVLEQLLARLIEEETIPTATALLPNYPNPFNPETWIPYQLATAADVTVTIYDINGHVVRYLDIGHQRAGLYHSRSRATHWDGKNAQGETVASGVYFYTLSTESTRGSVTAGDFTMTRKMLIRK